MTHLVQELILLIERWSCGVQWEVSFQLTSLILDAWSSAFVDPGAFAQGNDEGCVFGVVQRVCSDVHDCNDVYYFNNSRVANNNHCNVNSIIVDSKFDSDVSFCQGHVGEKL